MLSILTSIYFFSQAIAQNIGLLGLFQATMLEDNSQLTS